MTKPKNLKKSLGALSVVSLNNIKALVKDKTAKATSNTPKNKSTSSINWKASRKHSVGIKSEDKLPILVPKWCRARSCKKQSKTEKWLGKMKYIACKEWASIWEEACHRSKMNLRKQGKHRLVRNRSTKMNSRIDLKPWKPTNRVQTMQWLKTHNINLIK